MYRHMHGSMVLAAASLCALVAAPLASQNVFNGVITYKLDFHQMQGTEVVSENGDRIRMDLQTPMFQSVMLYDLKSGDMTTVIPAQKRYMTMNLRKMAEQNKSSVDETKMPDIVSTGKKETIAGHSCEVWTEKDKKMDACVATDLGHFPLYEIDYATMRQRAMSQGAPPGLKALVEHFKNGFVPLRVTFKDNDGTLNSMLATNIELKSVPSSMFAVPAGYQGMKMP